jgi:plastocyanin
MSQASIKRWSTTKLLVVVALVSIIGGALVGLGVSYGFHYEAPTKREFYMFNSKLNFNDTTFPGLGEVHSDVFSPDHITVNKGDLVVIHYINVEVAGGDPHSFTMTAGNNGGPYNTNVIVQPGQEASFNFTARWSGIFEYFCIYHTPEMVGSLVVQG